MSDVYINRGEVAGKTAIYPSGPNVYSGPGYTPGIAESANGLHIRTWSPETLAQYNSDIATNPKAIPLESWQYWCQDSWKKPHGTYESAERFGKKLREEHEELLIALYGLLRCPEEQKPTHRSEVIAEAGDVLWCLGAAASNASVRVDTAAQTYLYRASMGVLVWDGQKVKHPRWRNRALKLATKNLSLPTVHNVDQLLAKKFMPSLSTAMNIDPEDIYEECAEEMVRKYEYTAIEAMTLKELLRRQYGYGEEPVSAESYNKLGGDIGVFVARLFLTVGYVLHHTSVRSSVTEAIQANFTKISGRVAANLIDHADGDRPAELR